MAACVLHTTRRLRLGRLVQNSYVPGVIQYITFDIAKHSYFSHSQESFPRIRAFMLRGGVLVSSRY